MVTLDFNPLDLVPYSKERLTTFLGSGTDVFSDTIRTWYRGTAMAFHPDRAAPDKKVIFEEIFKFYNGVNNAINKADRKQLEEWINTQHSSGGVDDALLAGALAEIESLETRLNNAVAALYSGKHVTPAELLRIVDPTYGRRVEQLQIEKAGLQGRVDTAERNAKTYQQQVTDANARANKAEVDVRTYQKQATDAEAILKQEQQRKETALSNASQYMRDAEAAKRESATQMQRAIVAERTAQEQRDRASSLEGRLKTETERIQRAESKLETANQNLEHALKYGQGVFTQLQEAQVRLAAIEAAGRSAGVDPSMPNEQIFQEGTKLLRQEKDYQKAIGVFRFLLGRDPSNVEIYAHLGIAYRDTNQKELAVEQFQKVLDISPKHNFAQKNRDKLLEELYEKGLKLRTEKKNSEAVALLEMVVKYVPRIDAYANLGAAYRDLGEREKAIRYFRRALEINPNHQFSRQNLSRLEDITNLDYSQRIKVIGNPDSPQEDFQKDAPVYAVSSTLLKEAFRYLFTDNPEITGKGRLERLVYLFGSGEGDIRKVEGIAYPKLTDQGAAHVSAEQTDSNKILIALDEKGLAWYSIAHNHNWKMFNEEGNSTGAVSPSPIDVQNHERVEQAYKTFLTAIFSPDGYVGFWQPRGFEVFVDGKKLQPNGIPNLRENVKVYQLG